jgi:hypothetical protein
MSEHGGPPSAVEGTGLAGLGEEMVTAQETRYWAFAHRQVTSRDIGHSCRECKVPFKALGETITVRRGGRIELRYHVKCFSGWADPRTQNSATSGKWGERVKETKAPVGTYNKMRTSSHW